MTADEIRIRVREEVSTRPYGYQARLSRELDIDHTYLNHVLRGRTPMPLRLLVRILDALGLKLTIVPKDAA